MHFILDSMRILAKFAIIVHLLITNKLIPRINYGILYKYRI